MKKSKSKISLILILVTFLFAENFKAQNYALFETSVVNQNEKEIDGIEILVFQNDSLVSNYQSTKKASLKIKLESNSNYRIEFGGHDEWVKKKLKVSTFGLVGIFDNYIIQIMLFRKEDGMDVSNLEKEIVTLEYNPELDKFDAIPNQN